MAKIKQGYITVKNYLENNLDSKEGWTIPGLAKKLEVSVHTARYVLQMLETQGVLVRVNKEKKKGKHDCKIIFFVRENYEKDNPKNWALESNVDVHNIFRPPHCGGRG